MKMPRVLLAPALSLFVILSLSAAGPSDRPDSTADRYFGCPGDYVFQTKGQTARCYKEGSEMTSDISCAVGYLKILDQFEGGRDGCMVVGFGSVRPDAVSNYACLNGFVPKIQAGPDMCMKRIVSDIAAPSVAQMM